MTRVFNFSAGPAVLPEEVLVQARDELLAWRGTGMSVMEMSHRGKAFVEIAETAERDLRDLLAVPDDYRVLFMQGGATSQFSMVPMNLMGDAGRADYVDTGIWSRKAIAEARRFGKVNVCASAAVSDYAALPDPSTWTTDPDAGYLHYTPNETIGGLEFQAIPATGEVPLVADASSTLLSRPLDVRRFGLIYAGAQKNIGPAGLTLVIVRDDLPGRAQQGTPSMFDYRLFADNGSMLNTPPTFAWYLAGLVFQWLKRQGGLVVMAERNRRKADLLYRTIDESDYYHNPVDAAGRSWMNVPFTLADPGLDSTFHAEAKSAGLVNLAGHRSVGGMRASLYNAMPQAGVEALVGFMGEFVRTHG